MGKTLAPSHPYQQGHVLPLQTQRARPHILIGSTGAADSTPMPSGDIARRPLPNGDKKSTRRRPASSEAPCISCGRHPC